MNTPDTKLADHSLHYLIYSSKLNCEVDTIVSILRITKQKPQRKYWAYVRANENNWTVSGKAEAETSVVSREKAGKQP